MNWPTRPIFRQLDRSEVQSILERNQMGRMVFCRGNYLEVEPVQYLYAGGWLYGRSTHAVVPDHNGESPWPAAFEVDEIRSASDWRTVVVHGGFYPLSEDGAEWEQKERAAAIQQLRQLVPTAFTPDDPTPALDVVFRIAVQEVSGRATIPDTGKTGPASGLPGNGRL
ncbi:MAG: pyridoxamine 5'-phosphate oxidase family protein [Gemmatimonadota bacterium]|jgi:nitroimidazol reductase NimA-like FMN-containing flavoprotein (pyridoxamine 5'-phosphate oxidase superfamily)|nr:pyridoxamine 5'-phosphate oxidase family protein [Gemmatimonadota bacterium]